MSTKTVFKRVALVAAAALAIGGISAVSAQAAGITTPSAATQTLGAITRTALNTWTEPVTISLTSSALAAGQTVSIAEVNSGTSTATNVVATAGSYTLLAGDVSSATAATFTTSIVYTATAATAAGEVAALGTQILTATIGGTAITASSAVTVVGNANLNVTTASTLTGGGATATQIAGPANFAIITDTGSVANTYFTIAGGTTTTATTSGVVAAGATFNIATPTAGTITISGYAQTSPGIYSATVTDVVTITVAGALPGTLYASTAVLGAPGVTVPTNATDGAFSVVATAALPAATAANFTLQENDASGIALTSGFKALAVISTVGTLSVGGAGVGTVTGAGGYASGIPSGAMTFALSNNGQAGVSTVSITINGIAVKSYSVTFSGAAARIVLTVINPVVAVGVASTLLAATQSITANTNALEIQEFDTSGNLLSVNTGVITLTSSNAAIATASSPIVSVGALPVNHLGGTTSGTALSSTVAGVSLTGLVAGSTTFTATDALGAVTSLPVTVRVSSGVPTSVVFTTNSNTYTSGGVGTLTTTLSNAAGTLPAGTYLVLSYAGATSSFALTSGTGTLPAAAVTVNDMGVYTDTFNAPISDGTVTISAVPAVATITVVPATFTVASSATASVQKAIDAANEATSAAKASTVAATAAGVLASQAVQAAKDAGAQAATATAAVAALSVRVTNVLAKIAALSKLILRLIKKAHA